MNLVLKMQNLNHEKYSASRFSFLLEFVSFVLLFFFFCAHLNTCVLFMTE